ncbi:hypothetical protein [Methylopila turkensis]|uniref:Uncharacterized protein n=1 Tax=Methylopila turkensis TaxID=1437816 RepID=A0A9W6JP16_9HYPH|nr:hypothetical protein [Methylopila turkensis]GLK79896.1 hypothetical protein GCM10008174_16370 [Methylopila turkensis]
MSMPAVVDVALGVVLMYLILSLAVTAIGEIISTTLSLRGRHLSRTIGMLLDDDAVRKRFYEHGLIVSAKTAARGGEALDGTTTPPDAAVRPPAPATDKRGVPRDKDHPSYFDPRVFAMALLDSLGATAKAKSLTSTGTAFGDLKQLAEALPEGSKLRDVVTANLAAAEGDLTAARDNLASWFDSAMDRLSGDFARESKRIALGVGLVLAVALNADTFAVARALWADKDLRANVAAVAEAVKSTDDLKPACAQADAADRLECQLRVGSELYAKLQPFPIGWGTPSTVAGGPANPPEPIGLADLVAAAVKVLGLAFTGLALSFGAPFWFDLLQKIVNLRGAGPKPKKTADG